MSKRKRANGKDCWRRMADAREEIGGREIKGLKSRERERHDYIYTATSPFTLGFSLIAPEPCRVSLSLIFQRALISSRAKKGWRLNLQPIWVKFPLSLSLWRMRDTLLHCSTKWTLFFFTSTLNSYITRRNCCLIFFFILFILDDRFLFASKIQL